MTRYFGRLWILLFVLALAAGWIYIAYSSDYRKTVTRLTAGSQVVVTDHGPVEYARWGNGPAVLALHGAGGGYDQGVLLAEAFGGEGFQWIAPSRFGYLRSPLPADASTAAQADALADLLNTLEIPRVEILAMSGGVPPALQFALRHPDRTTALVLLSSAPYTPLTASQQDLPVPIWFYQALFSSDFPYWALATTARPSIEAVFDVQDDLRAVMTPEERAFVTKMIDSFAPVTRRVNGLANEGAAIDPTANYRLEGIRVPTLVIHARDDGINPFAFGEYTAENIRNSEFVPLASGGHLLLGHHAALKSRIARFLSDHTIDRMEH